MLKLPSVKFLLTRKFEYLRNKCGLAPVDAVRIILCILSPLIGCFLPECRSAGSSGLAWLLSIPAADCIRKLKMGRASGYSAAFDGSLSLRIPSEEESGSRPTHPVHVSMR